MEMIELELLANEPFRPLKVSEFEQLGEAGCFDDERVELLYGVVVPMSPPHESHDMSIARLNRYLVIRLGDRATVRPNLSFHASEISMPVPDLLVVGEESWTQRPRQALLAIEVTRTSVHRDHVIKARLYAESQVAEYWIVDHNEGVVVVMRDSRDGAWQQITRHARGETVRMLAFPDVEISVDEILPPGT